jgi:hypothetical protein
MTTYARRSARVLLIDAADRLLLIRSLLIPGQPDSGDAWFTPAAASNLAKTWPWPRPARVNRYEALAAQPQDGGVCRALRATGRFRLYRPNGKTAAPIPSAIAAAAHHVSAGISSRTKNRNGTRNEPSATMRRADQRRSQDIDHAAAPSGNAYVAKASSPITRPRRSAIPTATNAAEATPPARRAALTTAPTGGADAS